MQAMSYAAQSHTVTAGYLCEVLDEIEALSTRPCVDRSYQHIEGNICNLSKALLNQIRDYQVRYDQILEAEAGPIEDNKLSKAQLGLPK
jgi:hypothetical protein